MVYTPHPEAFLSHPSIVGEAPWCRYLENFELMLLLGAPLRGLGRALTRGELAKRLESVPAVLVGKPALGDLYYQRVSRAVTDLETWSILGHSGRGRRRGYFLTPAGFVTLILNLRSLRCDPIIEPAEFEMRREIVAATNVMLSTLFGAGGTPGTSRDVQSFFREVDAVSIAGTQVMSAELVVDTTSILNLIARQREHIERLKKALELAAAGLERELGALKGLKIDLRRRMFDDASEQLVVAAVERARLKLPFLSVRAQGAAYERYLNYLDELASIYAGSLEDVSLNAYRRARGRT